MKYICRLVNVSFTKANCTSHLHVPFYLLRFWENELITSLFYVFIAFQISFKKKMNLLEKMNGLVASVSGDAVCKRKSQQLKRSKKTCRISGQTNGNMSFHTETTGGEIVSVKVRRGAKFKIISSMYIL